MITNNNIKELGQEKEQMISNILQNIKEGKAKRFQQEFIELLRTNGVLSMEMSEYQEHLVTLDMLTNYLNDIDYSEVKVVNECVDKLIRYEKLEPWLTKEVKIITMF